MALYKTMTDNDSICFTIKVNQRKNNLPDKKQIKVLDAFAGEGKIWNKISKSNNNILLTRIEKRKGLHLENIECGNLYWMCRNDLTQFDVIDLDDYGWPYNQLCQVFEQKYKGVVFFTAINSGLGTLPRDMLSDLFGSVEIARKCRTMFKKSGFDMFCKWLKKKGVNEVFYQSIKNSGSIKFYGYFYCN